MNHQDIINYLEGKTSVAETDRIQRWLKNPDNETEVRKILGEIWMQSRMELSGSKPDFEGMLNQVHHLISLKEQSILNEPKPIPLIRKFFHQFSRAAAILIIPLLLFSGYHFIKNITKFNAEVAVSERIITTKPGTRTKVQLDDGTVVWLNDGTTLKYPERFVNKERHVYVDGEAYFEVKANPKKPFIVENPMMNTCVTGTKFNLNAYVDDNYFEATLIEGKIGLKNMTNSFKMEPGFQVQYNKSTEKILNHEVNTSISTAWINGKLVLQNEPLSVAVKKLSRWYNIEIIIQSPKLNEYLLTATIEDEKPEQTFKLISYALPIKYSIKTTRIGNEIKRTIYLTGK
jgi:ferric-dicitrate binding protein FerR (iron transport regulator)